MYRNTWRKIKAFWILQGARGFGLLLGIASAIFVFAIFRFHAAYVHPETGLGLSWMESAWQVLGLLFFQAAYPMPIDKTVGLFFFLIPIGNSIVIIRVFLPLFRAIFNQETWNMALAKTLKNHVIVCGLGRVGYRTIHRLRDFKEEVVGIGLKDNDAFIDELRALDIPIILADARRPEVLLEAGLKNASAIVPCTNDDLANFDIALIAQKENPGIKIVMRMFDDDIAENIRHNFGKYFSTFSTSEISGRVFAAAAATKAPIDFAMDLQGEEKGKKLFLTIGHFALPAKNKLCGVNIEDFEESFQASVLALRRNETVQVSPKRQEILATGDVIMVSAELENLEKIYKALSLVTAA